VQHRSKRTLEGDMKAYTNQERADYLRAVLAKLEQDDASQGDLTMALDEARDSLVWLDGVILRMNDSLADLEAMRLRLTKQIAKLERNGVSRSVTPVPSFRHQNRNK
jgi:U3 small nucleolar ribonucleoprotein component